MALKITLKPNEHMILGNAVITNSAVKCEFIVENNVAILRQNDILSPNDANTPALRIYLAIQLMYVDETRIEAHQKLYWQLVRDFIAAAPSSLNIIHRINELILESKYYQALKAAQQLIQFEQEVIEGVTKCSEILPVCR